LTWAVIEGELETTVDPLDAVAMLNGPVLYRTSMQAGTVSDDLIDRLIESVGTWSS
jgi:hypothetical protein